MTDPRVAYVVPKGSAIWFDAPSDRDPDLLAPQPLALAPDGVGSHRGPFVEIFGVGMLLGAHGDARIWIHADDLHSTVLEGDDDAEVGAEASRTFGPYAQSDVDALLQKVRAAGMTVTGSNPWKIDTHSHGVTLTATYDAASRLATIHIDTTGFLVSNAAVWGKLTPMMPAPNVGAASATSSSAATPAAAAPAAPTIDPTIKLAPIASALAKLEQLAPPSVVGEWRGTRWRDGDRVGDDTSPPADTATNDDKIAWLASAEKRFKAAAERANELEGKAKTKAIDTAREVGQAIDKAVGDLLEHGAAGTLLPGAEQRARAIFEENKGTLATLGGAYLGFPLAIAIGAGLYFLARK